MKRNRLLSLIAALKFGKSLLLILAGVGAIELGRPAQASHAREWLLAFTSHPARELAHWLLARLGDVDATHLKVAAAACFLFAALFLVEGTGLWLRKRWAEYLTVIATSLLVPLELYELARKLSLPRFAALLVNLAVVAYLIHCLREKDHSVSE